PAARRREAHETLLPARRYEYQCGPTVDQRFGLHSVRSVPANNDTRVSDRSRSHMDTPALPFCHLLLKARKPRSADYPTRLNSLGDRVRARRLDLALTQKDLARRLRIDATTVNNWETGRAVPALRLLPRIIQFLDYAPYMAAETVPESIKRSRHSFGMSQ